MSAQAIVLTNLVRRYGGLAAVDGASLKVEEGTRHALIGPNGAGKSTLFSLVAGTIRPTSGRIEVFGVDVTRVSEVERARMGIAKTFQHSSVFGSMSVLRNVMLAASRRYGRPALMWPMKGRKVVEFAESCLERVGLIDRKTALAGSLSHGGRRQLEVALALALEPRAILFDEPTAGMSANETDRFVELVGSLPRTLTVLMIEHDLDVVFNLADRITVLHLGKVLAEGSPKEIRASEVVQQTYIGDSDGASDLATRSALAQEGSQS